MKRVQVDVTAEVLAKRRALEKEYLDAGYMVPLPTRKEARALQGIPVYESRDVQPSNSALHRQRKKNPRSASKQAVAVKRAPPKPHKRKAKRATPPKWCIYARRTAKSPVMHYTGERFSDNGKPKEYPSSDVAMTTARALLDAHAVLRGFKVTVERKRKRNP